jgi:AcrR family transcriptional regulator
MMSERVKPRRYNAARRRQASRETRRRVLKAARELFLSAGYRATTIAAIATRAEVNADTVYELVGRKPTVLRELIEEAISGTDHPVAAEQRRYVQAIQAEADPARKIEIYARAVRRIQERMAPLFLALRDAAATEPEAKQVWEAISERRARNMRLFIRDVQAAGGLRDGMPVETAADTVWVMNSSEVYLLLTIERGWSQWQFERWLVDTWKRLILS